MVITEFDAGDPEATMHALADEILRFRHCVKQLTEAIGWASTGAPFGLMGQSSLDCDDYGFLGSHLRLEPLLRASRRLSLRKFNCATVNRESLRARQTVMAGTGRQSPRQAQAGGCSVKTVLQRSSMILSSLPPQMTTQLFACAFKRAAKAGEALFFAFGG